MSHAQVVPIGRVIPSGQSSHVTITKMAHVLRKQGQIEPLQVAHYVTLENGDDIYITHCDDVHGYDIVMAAKALQWPTLLVVVNKRYEY